MHVHTHFFKCSWEKSQSVFLKREPTRLSAFWHLSSWPPWSDSWSGAALLDCGMLVPATCREADRHLLSPSC